MTAEEIRAWRERMGIPIRGLAWALGVSYGAVWYWEHGRKLSLPFLWRALAHLEGDTEVLERARKFQARRGCPRGSMHIERDAEIVAMFLETCNKAEVGKAYGLTRERIRQIIARANSEKAS